MPEAGNNRMRVEVDLNQIRSNVRAIAESTGVPILAVVKSDAYGLGAAKVCQAITDLVDGFVFFGNDEVAQSGTVGTGKRLITIGPPGDVKECISLGMQPCVWTVEQAQSLRDARPIVNVDTGMQRFSCPPGALDAVINAGRFDEALTHATSLEQVEQFLRLVGQRGLRRIHATGSSLLHEPRAHLDAVRPGIAMYRGAARITLPLIDARDSNGPAGYSRFSTARHGVILAGYSQGLRVGSCLINGGRRRIMEVGMQSSFVELTMADRAGDIVTLLGDELSETEVAAAWTISPHEVLTSLCGRAVKQYRA